MRNPRACGAPSAFQGGLGYRNAYGYKYEPRKTQHIKRNKFSIGSFAKDVLLGAVMGGFSSALFYGAGKGVEKLAGSLKRRVTGGGTPLSLKLGEGKAIEDAMKNAGPSTNEYFNVFGHGNKNAIMFNGKLLNANQVAHLIKNSPQYVGGKQVVYLYACETGKASNGFAQQLANNLGVVVKAPNELIYPNTKGGFTIINSLFRKGEMVTFWPKK